MSAVLMSSVLVAAETVLAVVFAVSAIGKLRSRAAQRAFAESLRAPRLVPPRLVTPVVVAVIAAEVLIAIGLVVALLSRSTPVALVGLALAGALLVALTAGIVLTLRRGVSSRCACFGIAQRPLSRRHVARNGALLAVAAVGLLSLLLDAPSTPVPDLATLAVTVAVGVVVAIVVISSDDIIELFLPSAGIGGRSSTRG